MVPNPPTPGKAVVFNPDLCIGCNKCAEVCPTDVMMPNPDKKKPPIVLYPDECWGCGVCQDECPRPGSHLHGASHESGRGCYLEAEEHGEILSARYEESAAA